MFSVETNCGKSMIPFYAIWVKFPGYEKGIAAEHIFSMLGFEERS